MYASSLAEHNEATFVVFKVIEFAVITNYKYIAVAVTYNMHPSIAGLQRVIACPATTNGCSPYKSNILAIGGEYRVIFTIGITLKPKIYGNSGIFSRLAGELSVRRKALRAALSSLVRESFCNRGSVVGNRGSFC